MRRHLLHLAIWIGILSLIGAAGLSGCQPAPAPAVSSLIREEYLLEGPPDADAGTFQPSGTTQDAVLEKHQREREQRVYNDVSFSPERGGPLMASRGPGQKLTAALLTSPDNPPDQVVQLLEGENTIFSVEAGLPSPALPLQSLWTFDDHWVLEILFAEEEIWQGRIYQDGDLLNETQAYQEAFGFQLLSGKPFYFYRNSAGLGYAYSGIETALPYDEILHYGCCSAASLNPIHAENMVAFYALAGADWFYVELGDFTGGASGP